MFKLDQYACEKNGCYWSNYVESQDWGYYSRTEGDCQQCQDECDKDHNCGSFVCGASYCTWWKVGVCSTPEQLTTYFTTCRKSKY